MLTAGEKVEWSLVSQGKAVWSEWRMRKAGQMDLQWVKRVCP